MQLHNIIKSIALFLALSSTAYCITDTDVVMMYASLVEQWKEQISKSFDEAERLVYNVVPDIDDELIPNEDPAKCPCKGTGVIVHGDGHDTPCPFHSKEFQGSTSEVSEDPPLVKINKVTCECDTRCACDVCECQKTTVDLWLKKTEIK